MLRAALWAGSPRRAASALAGLAAAVLLAHLCLLSAVLQDSLGWGGDNSSLRRMEVTFVRELAQAMPLPVVATAPRLAVGVAIAAAPVAAASSPQAQRASEPVAPLAPLAPLPLPEPERADVSVLAATPEPVVAPNTEPVTAAATAPATPVSSSAPATPTIDVTRTAANPAISPEAAAAFEWPPSTRLSYNLTGHYRGPVQGSATVEWVKVGSRYQVHLEVSAGGLFSRRMSSEGDTTAQGLRPRRFEQVTKMIFGTARVLAVAFDEQRVRLANGTEVPLPAGVQDTASQFVQMTWMFTLKPELLQVGRTVDIPLALPNRVETWTYEVLAREDLHTPAGVVPTLHVKPRRDARAGGDLTAETWVAPSLQYLPVRIVIRQDAETFVDLLLKQLPQQAAASGSTPLHAAPPRR